MAENQNGENASTVVVEPTPVTTAKGGWLKKNWVLVLAVAVVAAFLIWAVWPKSEGVSDVTDSTAVVDDTTTTTVANNGNQGGGNANQSQPGDTTKADTTAVQPQPGGSSGGASTGNSGSSGGNAGGSAGNGGSQSNGRNAATALTVSDTVNVRNSPSKNGAIVQQLMPSDTLNLVAIDSTGKWVNVGNGWIAKSLVKNIPTGLPVSNTVYQRTPMLKPSHNGKDNGGKITTYVGGGWQ